MRAFFCLLFLLCCLQINPDYMLAGSLEGETKAEYDQRMQWWRDARFGLFVCWGPVTLTGEEIGWSRGGERNTRLGRGAIPVDIYDNLYKHWYPNRFNARQWVQTALNTGAKYMIFLVKHHDGFCLFDTEYTDYKSTSEQALWQKDVLKDISKACHELGLKLVIYYSLPDWYDQNAFTDQHQTFLNTVHGQVREIGFRYGKIDGFWFDLGGVVDRDTGERRCDPRDWDAENLFKTLHKLQPGIIINNRTCLDGDFGTPEQRLGGFDNQNAWEACVTLGTQWAWKPDDALKSLRQCIYLLVQCAGGDGNLALNTNPMPDGRIEPRQVQRFNEIGVWLDQYGNSIYHTRGGPFKPGVWGASTFRDSLIYLHILNWIGKRPHIKLPSIPKKIIRYQSLTNDSIDLEQTDTGIYLTLTHDDSSKLDHIITLELDGPAEEIESLDVDIQSLAFKRALNGKGWHSGAWAVDGDFASNWKCRQQDALEIDFSRSVTLSQVMIFESGDRIRKFHLQTQSGDTWNTIYTGSAIGEKKVIQIEPIQARFLKFEILDAKSAPRIAEFLVF